MRHFIVILITLIIFALYFIPVLMYSKPENEHSAWGLFYLPVVAISILWGYFLWNKWEDL